ncbi:MAG: GNAT family N-acetyltransferase, partial [Gammaproteobacteria bacterium]
MPEPIIIEALTHQHLTAATQVLKRSFPWENYLPLGQLSIRFYLLNQCYPLLGLTHYIGIEDTRFWVAVSATTQRVQGIIGLYSKTVDATESDWLDWFCVDPAARGQGIGGQLL